MAGCPMMTVLLASSSQSRGCMKVVLGRISVLVPIVLVAILVQESRSVGIRKTFSLFILTGSSDAPVLGNLKGGTYPDACPPGFPPSGGDTTPLSRRRTKKLPESPARNSHAQKMG